MDSFVDERDFELLARDSCTFSVLARILRGKCDLIRTDHRGLILCHSEKRYPVWLWTPDGLSDAEKEAAWALAAACRSLREGCRFNMKHELADYFTERGARENLNVGISMRLFAYDCPSPVPPEQETDGRIHVCGPEDAEETARWLARFCLEIGEEPAAYETRLEKAKEWIDARAFFFWKNGEGQTAASCSYRIDQGLGCIGSVYTLPVFRRKHYAQHLVYQVTERIRSRGLLPMLYTDADYAASNACYAKIGYRLRGRLCTVSADRR